MSIWCLFLDPHLTTYHSDTSVHISAIFNLSIFQYLSVRVATLKAQTLAVEFECTNAI